MFVITTEQKELERFFRDGPKIVGRAAAAMLTDMAFDMKNREIVDFMARKMTVRNRNFVKGRIRVQKARARSNVDAIMSYVGSVADKPRFSGWIEQELGRRTPKTRTMGLSARRGSKKRKALPGARLRPGRHIGPQDLGEVSTRVRTKIGLAKVMLVWTRREKYRKPFRLVGHDRIEDGLFKWKGRKLQRLQYFKRNKEAQPKRVLWLRGSQDKYMRRVDLQMKWNKALRRVMKWS